MRQAVMGAMAAMLDPKFTAWSQLTSTPPRYDAYFEFIAGLERIAKGSIWLDQDSSIARTATPRPQRGHAMEYIREASWNGAKPLVQFHKQPGFEPLRGYDPFDALVRPRR
ncbi:MAG TPA: hypothetical protein VMN60_01945 [Longimicrobiales bacterium]|nr:hypothetical protein [Longimicrobiales bacterium]